MRTLVIIPAYNEESNIKKTIEKLKEYHQNFDYIVINDCSTDHTRKICEQYQYNHINLPINLGIGGAVQTGYLYAWENDYDAAVQVDGDGQHDPAYLKEMVKVMEEQQAAMVIGSRFIRKEGFQSSFTRRLGIRYFTWLIRLLTHQTITDPTSGLRLVNREVIELFARHYPKEYPEPESTVCILRRQKKVVEIPVMMQKRTGGVSSISPGKSIYYMIKVTLAILIERIRH